MAKETFSGISLFAGCGGSDLGMAAAGIKVAWANEVNEGACTLYESVTGSKAIDCCDVRRVEKFPKADILCGCYPCQGYSQAGRRNGADNINLLYQEFDRALRQIRPLAFVVENVDGMRFSHNSHLLQAQLVRFRSAGYRVSWKMLDAKDFGLAQDRRRLFLVGIRSSEGRTFSFPAATHGIGPGLSAYRTQRDVIWGYREAPHGSYADEDMHWYYLSRNRWRSWDQQARCIVAHWRHVGLHPDSPKLKRVSTDKWVFESAGVARRLSYLECAALQGFQEPDRFKGISVRRVFKAIGNAVPPPLFGAVASSLVTQLTRRAVSSRSA
jgi:DNA (cytosine-5)-methyltransferase 1